MKYTLSSKIHNVKTLVLFFLFITMLLCPATATGKPKTRRKPDSSTSLRAMARIYMACGDYAKAQPLAEQALSLAQINHSSNSELCLALIDLAYLYNMQSKLTDAEQMCLLGLKLQEKIYYEKHPYIAYTLRTLSDIYQGQSKYSQATTALDRAITIMLDSHLPNDKAMTQFYIDRGKLLAAQGRFAEAETYYQRAMNSITKTYGPDHLYAAGVLRNISELYESQGKYIQAEKLINQAVSIQEKIYGAEHHFLAPAWLTMAKISQAKGEYSRAEKLLQKALDVVHKKQGADNPLRGKVLSALGAVYIVDGKYTKAERVCLEAVEILKKTLGPDNDRTAMALNNLAKLYIQQGKYSQAQPLCRRALSTLESIFERNHPNVVEVRQTIARLDYRAEHVMEIAKLEHR